MTRAATRDLRRGRDAACALRALPARERGGGTVQGERGKPSVNRRFTAPADHRAAD